MVVINEQQICVHDYQKVLMMDAHFFKIQMPHYILNIRGQDIQIEYYDQKEIRLKGSVKVIEYDEDRL